MPTNTTITTVKKRIVTVLKAALATAYHDGGQLDVLYAWDPSIRDEAVFLGPHPGLDDVRIEAANEIPTVKAGRKQGRERYDVVVTIWTARADLASDGAQTCEERAEAIFDLIYDEFADDPQIGIPSTVQKCEVTSYGPETIPMDRGYRCNWPVTVSVEARLQ